MVQTSWWDDPAAALVFVAGGFVLSLLSLVVCRIAPRYRGLIRASLGNASMTVGFLLVVLLERSVPWVGAVAGNTLIVLGAALVGNGLWAFLEKPARFEILSYLPPALILILLGALRFVDHAPTVVPVLVSFFLSLQFLASSLALFHNYPYNCRGFSRFIGAAFFFLALLFIARVFMLLDPDGYFAGTIATSHIIVLIGLTVGGTSWTFGLLLISATRLADELAAQEIDVNRRGTDLLVRTIIESVPQSIVLKDTDSRCILCNTSYASSLGKRAEDMAGSSDWDHFPERLAEKYRADDLAVMAQGRPSSFSEEYQALDGKLWVDTLKVPVRDQDGRISGVLVMFKDVTEQVEATQALEDSEHRFRVLSRELEHRVELRTRELLDARRDIELFFEVTIEYLAIVDMDGRLLKTSPSWSKELGWREDELVGSSFLDFVQAEEKDRVVGALKFIASRVPLRDFHLRFRKADGSWIWLSVAAVGVEDRQLIILAAHDITLQVEIEERLRTARSEAERASRAKSQFIATMSHELRTPLNAVLGYAALLDQMVEEERGRGYLKSIHTSGRALLAIINDILDLTRAEAGRIELVPVPFDLRRIQEELGDIFRFSVEEKQLFLQIRTTDRVPRSIMLDQARLRQILVNLVGNAIKFSDTGGVGVLLDALPAPDASGTEGASWKCHLKIEVTDTGIGIKDEYRARLFDPFSQQGPEISRKYGGTGLGLAIAKRLLDLMGGTIRCDSPEEGGTRFRIDIPQVVASGKAEASVLELGAATAAQSSSGRFRAGWSRALAAEGGQGEEAGLLLVLVDPEEGPRNALAAELIRRGFAVRVYGECRSAMEDGRGCDAALVSVSGRGEAEATRCEKFVESLDGVPVLALSDSTDRKTRLALLRSGALDVLRKPVDPEELVLRLRNQLRRARGAGPEDDARSAHLENLAAKLDRMAMTDELTGLAKRRYISNRIGEELSRCGRGGLPLALIMVDMDKFKEVNDRYGYQAGDYVLAECGKRIAESLRDGDAVGRWGGEEFLALLPDTDLESARRAAERIRFHLGNMPVIYGAESIYVTVSLGVSAMVPLLHDPGEDSATQLIRAADDALFRSKGRGGNRVEILDAVNPSGRPALPSGGSSRL